MNDYACHLPINLRGEGFAMHKRPLDRKKLTLVTESSHSRVTGWL